MQVFKIRFNNIAVNKFDLGHQIIDLRFGYSINDKREYIDKKFDLENGLINFVRGVMSELKKQTKERYGKYSDDPIEGVVSVVFDEGEFGETEEKLVKSIEKIKLKMDDFKRTKYSSDYMGKFHDLSSTIIDIK